jgi:hypothetical protein
MLQRDGQSWCKTAPLAPRSAGARLILSIVSVAQFRDGLWGESECGLCFGGQEASFLS